MSEAYLKPSQASKMKLLAKVVNDSVSKITPDFVEKTFSRTCEYEKWD